MVTCFVRLESVSCNIQLGVQAGHRVCVLGYRHLDSGWECSVLRDFECARSSTPTSNMAQVADSSRL